MQPVPALPFFLGLPAAIVVGAILPIQGRINGALGVHMNDGIGAAVVNFSTGVALMVILTLMLPAGRAGFARLGPIIRNAPFPRIYLLAGTVGALYVFAQSSSVPVVGVALFTVATVTGQTMSGLWVDRLGLGPAGKKAVTPMRIAGSLLTIAAVAWAVSPRLQGGDALGTGLWLLLPVLAGFLMSFNQAMNGTATVHYGTPYTTILVNFASGALALWIVWLISLQMDLTNLSLPGQWWYYLGGPLGCIFIGATALLVRSLGVLLTGLGMVAGQLLGSLALDLFLPIGGFAVTAPTILGTLLSLVAIVLTTLPWPRDALRRRVPVG